MNSLLIFFVFLFIIVFLYGKYLLFEKMHIAGWKGLIPIYSECLYFKKGKVNPILAAAPIVSFIVFIIFGFQYSQSRELLGICIFFSLFSVIYYLMFSLKANYYICRKFKCGKTMTALLTFFPYIVIPILGISSDYKWHAFAKVKEGILTEDFYVSRKVSVGEMCLTNVFAMMCVLASIYIFIYIFVINVPQDLVKLLLWSPAFIIVIVIFVSILVIGLTFVDYYANKEMKKR